MSKTMTAKQLTELLKKSYLRLAPLERKAGVPQSTLSKAVKGTRDLPENWVAPILKQLQKDYAWIFNNPA